MRNIAVFAVLVIILYCAPSLAALEILTGAYSFSAGQQFGLLYGQAEEIVYPPASVYKAPLHSQLLWDMKPVFYTGLLLDFARSRPMERPGFFSSLSVKFGFPGNSGVMEDRDWLSTENDALTNFSSHDNITKELFLFDIMLGYSIPIKHIALLKPFINVSYMRYRFSGQYGYAVYARNLGNGAYAPITESPDYHTWFEFSDLDSGNVINYMQEWYTAAPGISVQYFFLKYFCAELSMRVSPLIMCVDLDEHLISKAQYRDYTFGGLLLEPQLRVFFAIREWLELSLNCSWRHISESKGDSYQRPLTNNTHYIVTGTAGTGLSIMDVGFCLKVQL